MVEEEKIEERKRDNAPFLRAFQYLLDQNVASGKGELAKMIGIQPGLISLYTKGVKRVSKDTKLSLVRISKSKINMNYLIGLSQYMLLENVPDDEIIRIEQQRNNPDYNLVEKRREETEKKIEKTIRQINNDPIKDELIATLKSQLADLRCQLVDKDNIIESKNQLISSLRKQVLDLQDVINSRTFDEQLSNYPFPIGTAEAKEKPRADL